MLGARHLWRCWPHGYALRPIETFMQSVLIVIHILIVIALIVVVLLQRSEAARWGRAGEPAVS